MNARRIRDDVTSLRKRVAQIQIRSDGLAQSVRDLCRNEGTARYDAARENSLNHLSFMSQLLTEGLTDVDAAFYTLSEETKR